MGHSISIVRGLAAFINIIGILGSRAEIKIQMHQHLHSLLAIFFPIAMARPIIDIKWITGLSNLMIQFGSILTRLTSTVEIMFIFDVEISTIYDAPKQMRTLTFMDLIAGASYELTAQIPLPNTPVVGRRDVQEVELFAITCATQWTQRMENITCLSTFPPLQPITVQAFLVNFGV